MKFIIITLFWHAIFVHTTSLCGLFSCRRRGRVVKPRVKMGPSDITKGIKRKGPQVIPPPKRAKISELTIQDLKKLHEVLKEYFDVNEKYIAQELKKKKRASEYHKIYNEFGDVGSWDEAIDLLRVNQVISSEKNWALKTIKRWRNVGMHHENQYLRQCADNEKCSREVREALTKLVAGEAMPLPHTREFIRQLYGSDS